MGFNKILFTILVLVSSVSFAQTIDKFSYKDLKNEIKHFDDIKGDKITVIDFWTTWCKPCRKAIPKLNIIYDDFKDKGVSVIGLSCDGPRSTAKVGPVSRSLKIKYPVLLDITGELMNSLNLTSYPSLIITNSDGEIQYVHEGFNPGDEIEIREAIISLLNTD